MFNQLLYLGVYFYLLPNNNGLILYRTPAESTARYMIRRPGVGFLLPQ